ncbi:MAG: response regulator [Spirochaetes bacterium]|nr:MAG: response regulator [Spirochaetota bacterium]
MTKRKKILLIEDNPSDVILTKRAFSLKRVANEIVVAQDGQEALDYLFCEGEYAGRDTCDLPGLILLDLNLPKIDGITVLREIKKRETTRALPVVVLTTSNEDSDLTTCYNLGCNSYIRKPVEFGQFVEAVGQLGLYWFMLNQAPETN